MSDAVFGMLILGFLFFGLPALFFIFPYLYTKFIDQVEKDEFQQIIIDQKWLYSKKLHYSLLALCVISFLISVWFVHRADYSSAVSIYENLLSADLARIMALMVIALFILLRAIQALSEKIGAPDLKVLNLLFILGFLLILLIPINATYTDLKTGVNENEGILLTKRQVIGGRKMPTVEYYVYVSSTKNELRMKGDNSENGYEKVVEGDKVRIWYGGATKEVFLIEKLVK